MTENLVPGDEANKARGCYFFYLGLSLNKTHPIVDPSYHASKEHTAVTVTELFMQTQYGHPGYTINEAAIAAIGNYHISRWRPLPFLRNTARAVMEKSCCL